jgi:hypothetical protein
MRNTVIKLLFVVLMCTAPTAHTEAQIPVLDIIKEGIKKVIKAMDLMVQRLQNKTIALQNIQRSIENNMSKLKLNQISDWVNKQKVLYQDYFDELWKVKTLLSTYNRVQQIIQTQGKILVEYRTAFNRSQQDQHFTSGEIQYMDKVYGGILEESLRNLKQLNAVINGFRTQMTDAERLQFINEAGIEIDKNLAHLRQFNQQNIRISIQRSKEQSELNTVKKLYGLP